MGSGRARKLRRLADPTVRARAAEQHAVRGAADTAVAIYGAGGRPPLPGLPALPVHVAPSPLWAGIADQLASGAGYPQHLLRQVAYAERRAQDLLSGLYTEAGFCTDSVYDPDPVHSSPDEDVDLTGLSGPPPPVSSELHMVASTRGADLDQLYRLVFQVGTNHGGVGVAPRPPSAVAAIVPGLTRSRCYGRADILSCRMPALGVDFDISAIQAGLPPVLQQRFGRKADTVVLDCGLTATNTRGSNIGVYIGTAGLGGPYLSAAEYCALRDRGEACGSTGFLQRRAHTDALQCAQTGELTSLGVLCASRLRHVIDVSRARFATHFLPSQELSPGQVDVDILLCPVGALGSRCEGLAYCAFAYSRLQAQCGACFFVRCAYRVVEATQWECHLDVTLNPAALGESGALLGATFLFTSVPVGAPCSGDITAVHRDPDAGYSYRWVESVNASGGECLLFGTQNPVSSTARSASAITDYQALAVDQLGCNTLDCTDLTTFHGVVPLRPSNPDLPCQRFGVIHQNGARAAGLMGHLIAAHSCVLFLSEDLPALKASGAVLLSKHDCEVALRSSRPSSGRWSSYENFQCLQTAMQQSCNRVLRTGVLNSLASRSSSPATPATAVSNPSRSVGTPTTSAAGRSSVSGMSCDEFESIVVGWARPGTQPLPSVAALVAGLQASTHTVSHCDRRQFKFWLATVRRLGLVPSSGLWTPARVQHRLPVLLRSFLAVLHCTCKTRKPSQLLDYTVLDTMDVPTFEATFSSYHRTIQWIIGLKGGPAGVGGRHADVFQEAQLRHGPFHSPTGPGTPLCTRCQSTGTWGKFDTTRGGHPICGLSVVADRSLQHFAQWLSHQALPAPATRVTPVMQGKRPKLQAKLLSAGPLFTCFYLAILEDLGLVDYGGDYLPPLSGDSRGSVKVLHDLGFRSDASMRAYLRDVHRRTGVSALASENIACKIHLVNEASRLWSPSHEC